MSEETETKPEAPQASGTKPMEEWRTMKATPLPEFAAMVAAKHWGQGKEVSEAEYDEAIQWAMKLEVKAS